MDAETLLKANALYRDLTDAKHKEAFLRKVLEENIFSLKVCSKSGTDITEADPDLIYRMVSRLHKNMIVKVEFLEKKFMENDF